jgi:hypothetical protein
MQFRRAVVGEDGEVPAFRNDVTGTREPLSTRINIYKPGIE